MVTINVDASLNDNTLIIGAGEAGGRIAEEFKNQGFSNVVAINSAKADLDGLSIAEENKLLIQVTGGQGAGKNPRLVRDAVSEFYGEAVQFLNKHKSKCDSAIVVIGGGGGTGGGLGLVLAKAASEVGLNVGMIFTLPIRNESTLVFINALDNLKEIYENVTNAAISPFIVVDNNAMAQKYEAAGAKDFWKNINEAIVNVIRSFNENSKKPSKYISALDGQDLKRLYSVGGSCAIGYVDIAETDKADESIIEKIKNSFFVEGFDLTTAKSCGIVVTGNQNILTGSNSMPMINYVFNKVGEILGGGMIFRGVYDQDDVKFLRVYLIFNGMMLPETKISEMMKDINSGYNKMKSQENRIGDGVHVSIGGDVANVFSDGKPVGNKSIVIGGNSLFNKPAAPKININKEPKESTPDVKRRER